MKKITENYINRVFVACSTYINIDLTKIVMEYMKTQCTDCKKSYHFCDILIHDPDQCDEFKC